MKRTMIGVFLAAVLATVGTVSLVAYVRGAEERALAGEQVTEVLVLRENVARGTPVTQIGRAVSLERVPAKVAAHGSITSLDDLQGQVAAIDLIAGEQLVSARFSSPAAVRAARPIEVPAGLQEVTLSLAPQRALGGKLQPGDIVGVVASINLRDEQVGASNDQGEITQGLSLAESSKLILHRLLVTNIQVEQLPRSVEGSSAEVMPELAPTGNLLVTLAVDVPQTERIVFAAEYGAIWLTAQNAATDITQSSVRSYGNIYDE